MEKLKTVLLSVLSVSALYLIADTIRRERAKQRRIVLNEKNNKRRF